MKKKKKEMVEKKNGITLKMSSKEEELYDTSCEDEDAEMGMLARRYKKTCLSKRSTNENWEKKFYKRSI